MIHGAAFDSFRLCQAVAVAALLVNVFTRQQEARHPFYRVVELTDDTVDPEQRAKNFPLQYDGYTRAVDQVRTRYGGSEALPPRCGTRAFMRGPASPAPIATCPTSAPAR
jgi:hypothetical protein